MKNLIKTPQQIQNISDSCAYLTELLHYLKEHTKAGMSLIEVEELAQAWLDKRNLKGAFKGYEGFPANLCLSVNDCVVHGIPDETLLKNWDLLKIDTGVLYKKGISDACISMIIGDAGLNPLGAELIKITKQALDRWVASIETWGFAYDYSKTVYNHVKNNGFEIIKTLTGHGVGNEVHELPHFYNYPNAKMKKIEWIPWMIIALEPITAIKSDDVVYHESDRNLYCRKGDLGVQWEYTVLITENGPKVLAGVTEDWY